MRQAGIIAAGGLYALKEHVKRLEVDHEHARQLETVLQNCSWVAHCMPVQTNIVVAVLQQAEKRDIVIQKLGEQGVKASAFGPGMIRFVTHLDISEEQVNYTLEMLKKIAL